MISVKVWRDDRAKAHSKWVVTYRHGAIVEQYRFMTKIQATAHARMLRSQARSQK